MPNAVKVDKVEQQRRIRIVQEWLLQDFTSSDIAQQCGSKWNISERQAHRYINWANEGFAKITEKKLEKRLNYHIQRRIKMLRDLDDKYKKHPSGISVQLDILQDIAKLEKLYTLKIEHSGPDGAAIQTESTHKVVFEDYAG